MIQVNSDQRRMSATLNNRHHADGNICIDSTTQARVRSASNRTAPANRALAKPALC
jgi:hypothetical protein